MTDDQISLVDAFRVLWIAMAIDAGIDPQTAIDGHRDYVRELGIEEK